MAKETKYFQHDYNARNHIKLRRLRKGYGAVGYGLYWQLVEMMHEDERNGINIDDDVMDFIAEDNGLEKELVCGWLSDCVIKYKLFVVENGFYTSDRVFENKDYREQVRQKKILAGKEGAKKRWQNSTPIAPAIKNMADATKPIASAIISLADANSKMANDSILNESKGNESKEPIGSTEELKFIPHNIPDVSAQNPTKPILENVQMFFVNAGSTIENANSFYHHYDALGWKIGFSPILYWTALATKWMSNNQNRGQPSQQQQQTSKHRDARDILAERQAKK